MNRDLKSILYPYLFVLKEGKDIGQNPMDFSLMMLQVGAPEMLKSKKKVKGTPLFSYREIETFTSALSKYQTLAPSPTDC